MTRVSGRPNDCYWRSLAGFRRWLLLLTPLLLGFLLWSSTAIDHFGWGFFPWLVLTLVLTPIWLFVVFELVIVSALLLWRRVGGAVGRPDEGDEARRWRLNLGFDLWMIGYFALALALAFVIDS